MAIIKNPLEHLCAVNEEEVCIRLCSYGWGRAQILESRIITLDPNYFGPFIIEFFSDKPGVIWDYGKLDMEELRDGTSILILDLYVNASMIPRGSISELSYDLSCWIDFVANNSDIVQPEGELPFGDQIIPEALKSTPVDLQLDRSVTAPPSSKLPYDPSSSPSTKLPYEMQHRTGTAKTPMDFGTFSTNSKTPINYSHQNHVVKK